MRAGGMVDTYRLRRKLHEVRKRVEVAVKAQMEIYAAMLVAEMRFLVPVDSGALRDSIGWTWGTAPKGSMSIAAIKGRRGPGLYISIYVGTRDKSLGAGDAFYARWQEFGTKDMPANPFFYVVWRANRRRVRSGISRAAKKAAKSV